MAIDAALSTILSPVILFFVLGLGAALLRSDITFPEALSKGLAIYLMMAIGLKGGFEMAANGVTGIALAAMAAGVALSFLVPVIAFAIVRATTKLNRTDAAAIAAHYGSISIVTFVAATQAVDVAGLESAGYLVAVAALMETPAIITALLIAGSRATEGASAHRGELMREVLLNASIVVLVGALIIGWITGEAGRARVGNVFLEPLQGILCLFLLDMGLAAGRGLRNSWRALTPATIAFGVYMPLISASLAALAAFAIGLGAGDAAIFITLAASASYIAAPAAMRLALPKARPAIYLSLSLGITFPFNVTIGIPLYIMLGRMIGG
jgi:hypothetical protein